MIFTCSLSFSEPLIHKETGISFLDELAGFERTDYDEYELSELGVSYGYKSKDGDVATIYIYNAGITNIPNDVKNPIITQQREREVVGIIKYYQKKGKSVQHTIENATLKIPGNNKNIQVLFDAFIVRTPAIYTELWLWPARGNIFKIRMTPGFNSSLGYEQRKAFCDAVVLLTE